MKRPMQRMVIPVVVGVVGLAQASPASAHTESDLVAVPAGSAAIVTLQPTHGCAGSPTVGVRIRAPLEDAVAGDVDGWTAAANPDGAGNTVLEWSGGELPADEVGAFPVSFTVPDAPGVLLTFPAIQTCANGETLPWIDGDPTADFPAPRVLVLPAGWEPAATIDDVPLDAPGRQQLIEIVDVDAVDAPEAAPASTVPATIAPTTPTAPASTADVAVTAGPPATEATSATAAPIATPDPVPVTLGTDATLPTTTTVEDDDGSGNGAIYAVVGVAIVAAAMGALVVMLRRRAA